MTLTEMRAREQELRTELDRAYAELVRATIKADSFEAWCRADSLYMDALHAHNEIMSKILARI